MKLDIPFLRLQMSHDPWTLLLFGSLLEVDVLLDPPGSVDAI